MWDPMSEEEEDALRAELRDAKQRLANMRERFRPIYLRADRMAGKDREFAEWSNEDACELAIEVIKFHEVQS